MSRGKTFSTYVSNCILKGPATFATVNYEIPDGAAAGCQGSGGHYRGPLLHIILARGGDRVERSGIVGVLRWRHRGEGDRGERAVVHPRRDAVQLRGAL